MQVGAGFQAFYCQYCHVFVQQREVNFLLQNFSLCTYVVDNSLLFKYRNVIIVSRFVKSVS